MKKALQASKPKDRIIVALDVDSIEKAASLVGLLREHVGGFKIGLQLTLLMFSMSFAPIREDEALENFRKIRRFFSMFDRGQLFWDLKFHDIPQTIAGAAKSIQAMQVCMFNVHASAGIGGMRAAVANRSESLALAVTVLTSFEENNAHLIFGNPTKASVLQFARDAKYVGMDGIVCSPQELDLLGGEPELDSLLKVTLGIRDANAQPDDQKRTMTAAEAIVAGAHFLVIGRPITGAGDCVAAAKKFTTQIAGALEGKKAA